MKNNLGTEIRKYVVVHLKSSWAKIKFCMSNLVVPSSAALVGKNICFFIPGSPPAWNGSAKTGSYPMIEIIKTVMVSLRICKGGKKLQYSKGQ